MFSGDIRDGLFAEVGCDTCHCLICVDLKEALDIIIHTLSRHGSQLLGELEHST